MTPEKEILTPSDWLKNEFLVRRRKNPAYSLRAFARFLQLPSGRVSELLTQRRKLTPKIAERIADRLALDPSQRREFFDVIDKEKNRKGEGTPALTYTPLTEDTFYAISDWCHYAILNLVNTEGFKSEPRWIAEQLGISTVETRAAIERLIRLELLQKSKGQLVRIKKHFTSTHDVSSAGLRRFHKQVLEKAIKALEEVSLEYRDITSITLAINLEKLPQAKDVIRQFRRKMAKLLEVEPRGAVYSLNIQLVPLSRFEKIKRKTTGRKQ